MGLHTSRHFSGQWNPNPPCGCGIWGTHPPCGHPSVAKDRCCLTRESSVCRMMSSLCTCKLCASFVGCVAQSTDCAQGGWLELRPKTLLNTLASLPCELWIYGVAWSRPPLRCLHVRRACSFQSFSTHCACPAASPWKGWPKSTHVRARNNMRSIVASLWRHGT